MYHENISAVVDNLFVNIHWCIWRLFQTICINKSIRSLLVIVNMNPKLNYSIFALPVIIIVMTANFQYCLAQTTVYQQKYISYTSPIYGIKIKYPSDWFKKDTGLPDDKNAENKTIVAFRPHEGGVVFVITMHKLPKNSTLQSDIKYGVDQIHKSANSMASDIRITESSPTVLSHYPAHRIKYGFTMGVGSMKVPVLAMQVFTVVNNTDFTVLYTGSPDPFLFNADKANFMINSLQIM